MSDSATFIPDSTSVIPGSASVIPDSTSVIPDSIRDPVVRQYWIAGQARNDNAASVLTNGGNRLTMPYLKFLQLVSAVRQLPIYPAMDATEVQTLNALAQEWHLGNKISVVQAMGMLPDVSPSSVHRRLKTLRAKGFVSLQEDEFDNRIKYIIGTRLFARYLAQMDRCLTQAVE